MSDAGGSREASVGFWRHVPWVFTIGLVVSFGLSAWISAYFDSYAGVTVAIWVSLLYAAFKGSKEKERERIERGDPHPARRPSTSGIEISLAGALVVFCVGFAVISAYIRFGGDQRVPTPAQGLLAGTAMIVAASYCAALFMWAKKKRTRKQGAPS